MTKLERLRLEALASTAMRGHDMTRFYADSYWRVKRHSDCKHCGLSLTINSKPMPNEIDIRGPAVALGCTGEKP